MSCVCSVISDRDISTLPRSHVNAADHVFDSIVVLVLLFFLVFIAARASCGIQLTAGFLHGTSAPQACWTIIGVGIRMAQDVGAHRKKVYSTSPTIEEELWRRAFWCVFS